MDGRLWKTCLSETDEDRMMRQRRKKKQTHRNEKEVKQTAREKKREKSQEEERKERGSFRGEDRVPPFFPLVFDGPIPVFFFPNISFFDTGSRDWLARAKPPGVSPSLSFPPIFAVSDHLPVSMPGHLGNSTPLERARKYFTVFYYLFICC